MGVDWGIGGPGPTKRVAALLEVVKKCLAHADSAPFVFLVGERHGGGLRGGEWGSEGEGEGCAREGGQRGQ